MKVINVASCLDVIIYSILSLSIVAGIIMLGGCQTTSWDSTSSVSSKGTITRDSPLASVDGNGNVTRNQIPPNGGTDEKSDRSPVEPP